MHCKPVFYLKSTCLFYPHIGHKLYNYIVYKIYMNQFLVRSHPPSINARDKIGNTPLHLASLHGRTEVACFLINKGAKVDIRWEILWMTCVYILG